MRRAHIFIRFALCAQRVEFLRITGERVSLCGARRGLRGFETRMDASFRLSAGAAEPFAANGVDIRSGVAECAPGQMVTSAPVPDLIHHSDSRAIARILLHVVFVISVALPGPFGRLGLRGCRIRSKKLKIFPKTPCQKCLVYGFI